MSDYCGIVLGQSDCNTSMQADRWTSNYICYVRDGDKERGRESEGEERGGKRERGLREGGRERGKGEGERGVDRGGQSGSQRGGRGREGEC